MRTLAIISIAVLALASCGKSRSCIDPSLIDSTRNCGQVYDPVCGCDDYTYRNPCEAERYGVVSWIGGPCFQ